MISLTRKAGWVNVRRRFPSEHLRLAVHNGWLATYYENAKTSCSSFLSLRLSIVERSEFLHVTSPPHLLERRRANYPPFNIDGLIDTVNLCTVTLNILGRRSRERSRVSRSAVVSVRAFRFLVLQRWHGQEGDGGTGRFPRSWNASGCPRRALAAFPPAAP